MNKNKKDINKKEEKMQVDLDELMTDLQRTRADFENYRKRIELEKDHIRANTKAVTILKLLPVIDNIERAVNHTPQELQDHKWVQGITGLAKNLDKSLAELGLKRIEALPGTPFDPNLHEAIMLDDGAGDHEVIAEELQAGYTLGDIVIRHSLVKVTKTDKKEK